MCQFLFLCSPVWQSILTAGLLSSAWIMSFPPSLFICSWRTFLHLNSHLPSSSPFMEVTLAVSGPCFYGGMFAACDSEMCSCREHPHMCISKFEGTERNVLKVYFFFSLPQTTQQFYLLKFFIWGGQVQVPEFFSGYFLEPTSFSLGSDWSDGPVCCDWSTLLWLVRWSSLLW